MHLQDFVHRQHIGLHDVLQSRDKRAVIVQLLVPPTETGREHRANQHLVDRRIELDPRKAARKGSGVFGKKLREIRVLKIAKPIRSEEMAEIGDRINLALPQFTKRLVREGPLVSFRTEENAIERDAVTQEFDSEFFDAIEIRSPVGVVATLLHLINPRAALMDRRTAVFHPCGEHERIVHVSTWAW